MSDNEKIRKLQELFNQPPTTMPMSEMTPLQRGIFQGMAMSAAAVTRILTGDLHQSWTTEDMFKLAEMTDKIAAVTFGHNGDPGKKPGELSEEEVTLARRLSEYVTQPYPGDDPVENELHRGLIQGAGLMAGAVLSIIEGQEIVPPVHEVIDKVIAAKGVR
jgi:hypothetical protein